MWCFNCKNLTACEPTATQTLCRAGVRFQVDRRFWILNMVRAMFSAPTRAACLNLSGSRKRRSGRKQCTNDVVGRLLRLILNDPLDPLDLYFLIGLKESMMPVSCLWQFTLNHSLPFFTLSLYVSLFWSDTPVQMAHLAVWNRLRFMTVEHIPENASVTLHPMQTNLSLWTLALRGQAMPRPSSAVLVPLILMEVPFLWIASCRSFVSSLLPPDSEEGHGGTTSPTSSS